VFLLVRGQGDFALSTVSDGVGIMPLAHDNIRDRKQMTLQSTMRGYISCIFQPEF